MKRLNLVFFAILSSLFVSACNTGSRTDAVLPADSVIVPPLKDMKLTAMRSHNKALEASGEYRKIEPLVMKEVYRRYAENNISDLENNLSNLSARQRKSLKAEIKRLRSLLDKNPQEAAQQFMRMGSCYEIWSLKKQILKNKYNITWYSPAELNPDAIFD